MDKGAHFHKTDLQVHTPRDIRWSGGDAITDAERKTYAEELIRSCREKGLGAIAITDHHDFAFFPYVRMAAQRELDDTGQLVADGQKIVVFPGLELTLTAPTCQALLLLDANFPENMLPSVLTALSITPAPSTDSKTVQVARIPTTVVNDLGDLYRLLDTHEHIKGRFTVFPNVSEGGNSTILRSGFSNYYKDMPCVGGYVDGAVTQHGAGNISIVNGKNRDYGFRSIGLFQTSDNRRRGHADLGRHTTWVKWSEPTAEALRQACLARESRLSQDEPQLPNLWVTSMSVSNSKFLGRLEIDFNQQYNAVIGGRGTGKSTILEYLRWGLCDQPVDDADSDIGPVQVRRKKLIDDTLQKVDGEVVVTFLLNGVTHIVKRNSSTQQILLKIGEGEFAQVAEEEVRNLFPVQAYSQKQLSSVGVRIEELNRFVELPLKQTLDQTRSDIRDTEAKIRVAYSNVIRKREIEGEMDKHEVEIDSLKKQLTALRATLKGLSEAEQEIIKLKTQYDTEGSSIEKLKNELARAKSLVENFSAGFSPEEDEVDSVAETPNAALVAEIRQKYEAKFSQIRTQIEGLSGLFVDASLEEIQIEIKKWYDAKDAFNERYEATKAKAQVNQEQLDNIQIIENRVAELGNLQHANQNALTELRDPESAYAILRSKWDELHTQKINALDGQCQKFSSLSDGLIKAEVKGSLDKVALIARIKSAFTALNIRESKIEEICQRVADATDPVTAWNETLAELEQLALRKTGIATPVPATPILNDCEFKDAEKARLVAGFDSAKWLDLSLVELEFNPKFQYCSNKTTDEYIDFADASAGQQATALLTVLLNQNGAPLIIDQPEDDVDSKMSPDTVKQIWKAKGKRQIIFASHNANFVVNGDAELVIICDYVRSGDQTGGRIKMAGAIDNPTIKEEITLVTEGGKDAFKLRMEKYGF
ncbi:MAG: AAA family ATPase [Candidatus Paceibacterota bacterium]